MAEENKNGEETNGKEAQTLPPIIIKRIKKVEGSHHGGAWKVAYADFVTAMMAFFLLLWLLNVTTDEQKEGIAEYFSPTIAVSTQSGGAGVFGGSSPFTTDTSISASDPFGFLVNSPKATDSDKEQDVSEEKLEELVAEKEREQFEQAEHDLRQAIQDIPELQQLAESLLIEQTPEGLRIQIVDQENRSMFPLGSAAMYDHTKKLIALVAKVIERLPNKVAIGGHTDSAPYRPGATYTNWELSADRANASRRVLIEAGLNPGRIARVSGQAETELLEQDDPYSARNRRISILLLRGTTFEPIE